MCDLLVCLKMLLPPVSFSGLTCKPSGVPPAICSLPAESEEQTDESNAF